MRSTLIARVAAHPLFLCGFRPFYLATAGYAVLLLAAWMAFLAGLLPMPDVAGGLLAWHVHELIYGFALASVAGFLLTAVPEFTGCGIVDRQRLLGLALLWLLGRLAFWLSGAVTIWPAALFNLGLLLWLLTLLAPAVLRDPARAHMSFVYALTALAAVQAGFFLAVGRDADPMPWLQAAGGVLMILLVIAMSRISMRLINGMLEGEGVVGVEYLARPPRRNLAMFAIALHTASELWLPDNPVIGWLALAAAAAMFNLLNDWHIGRALFNRWIFMLYGVYWLMALGYGLMGLSLLAGWPMVSAGRHLLLAGAMSLAILAVMAVAGRIHAGHWLDRRPWVPIAAGLIALGALLRAAAALPQSGGFGHGLLALSGLAWAGGFALYLAYSWRVLAGPRPDNAQGCSEPARNEDTPAGEFAC